MPSTLANERLRIRGHFLGPATLNPKALVFCGASLRRRTSTDLVRARRSSKWSDDPEGNSFDLPFINGDQNHN